MDAKISLSISFHFRRDSDDPLDIQEDSFWGKTLSDVGQFSQTRGHIRVLMTSSLGHKGELLVESPSLSDLNLKLCIFW